MYNENFFVIYSHKQENAKGEKNLSKKKESSHIGAWLKVDDKNKEVQYQADSSWMINTSDEEQKIAFTKLDALVDIYRRAGYAIIDIAKKLKK